jgi:hypothetical protein
MRITKRYLRRIIKEELKRELISEVDTSADGSFSSQWEKLKWSWTASVVGCPHTNMLVVIS